MGLIDKMRADMLEMRKAGDRDNAAKMAALVAEAVAVGKNDGNRETTDAEAVAVVRKFVNNIEATLALDAFKCQDTVDLNPSRKLTDEADMYRAYMPAQLSPEELRAVIAGIVAQVPTEQRKKGMGVVMSSLKANYAGRYDGALASAIVKEVLA